MGAGSALVAAMLVLVLAGCVEAVSPGDDGGNDAATWPLPPPHVDKVDLLLMIDNSCSMTEEQASVISEVRVSSPSSPRATGTATA